MINSKLKKIIKKFQKTPVDKDWLEKSQEQMIEFMEINPVRKAEVGRLMIAEGIFPLKGINHNFKLLILKPMPIAIIALLISLATGSGVVAASQASLPTDALYPIKIATEQIQEAMTFNNTKKIDLAVKLAEKRLDEIKQLQKQGEISTVVMEKTLVNYEKHLAVAQSQLAEVSGDYTTAKAIAATVKYENSLEKQQEKLAALTNQASLGSQSSLVKAQQANIVNSNQALEKIKIKIQETENSQANAGAGTGVSSGQIEILSTTAMAKIPEYILDINEKTKNRINTAENKLAEIRKKIDNFSGQNKNKCGLIEKSAYLEKLETNYQKMQAALIEAQKLFDRKDYLTALNQINYVMTSAIDIDNLVGQWRGGCDNPSETPSSVKCTVNNDCKLIYSNCDCEVVSINDPKTFLDNNNEICKWNICHETNVTAVCRDNKCIRSDNQKEFLTCRAPTCVGAYQTGESDSKNCPIYKCPKNECQAVFSNCSCAYKCMKIIEGQGQTDYARACSLNEITNYQPSCGYRNGVCQDLIKTITCPDIAIDCSQGSTPTQNGNNENGCPIWSCKPTIPCPLPTPYSPDWCKDGKIYPGEIDSNGCHGAPRCVANEIDGSDGSSNSGGTKQIVEPNESNTSNSAQTSQGENSTFDSILKFLQIK
ncbi:MAG: DUF5667 domain-containing protein [bacterium]|nr:DUF5667 domain-containing protein [bacterium]